MIRHAEFLEIEPVHHRTNRPSESPKSQHHHAHLPSSLHQAKNVFFSQFRLNNSFMQILSFSRLTSLFNGLHQNVRIAAIKNPIISLGYFLHLKLLNTPNLHARRFANIFEFLIQKFTHLCFLVVGFEADLKHTFLETTHALYNCNENKFIHTSFRMSTAFTRKSFFDDKIP